ncbi:MAG: DNA-processing protein DprA [bacterium]|nr:DNA-processing protein DprA [bacterium]
MTDERIYYQSIARFDKIGPVRLRNLLKTFSSVEAIWNASAGELAHAGLGEQVAAEFTSWRKDQDIEKQWEELEKEEINVATWNDPEYPPLLKEIHDPPHTLFIRGALPQSDFTLAVVGTRMATVYGRQIVQQIVRPLARTGMVIVSGLALGIDALVHTATLDEQGVTVAVLGGGCDRASIYPTSNRALAERIVEQGGALISEYHPKSLAMPYHFPIRNRIIAGMSRGTFVIEAAEDSGSLITAKHALEQNREVFTVPGDITRDTSKGPNNLLKMGAHPVLSADDILDILNLHDLKTTLEAKKIIADDPIEEAILTHITDAPIHIDELVAKTKLGAGPLSSSLTLMEMKGKVRHIGGMNYVLAR